METGTKIAIGVAASAVVGFGIYWFFIREGEDAAAAITGTKPINEMTPAELKAMGGGKLNITQSVLDLLTPEQKAALKSAGTAISVIKDEAVTPATASKGEESPIAYVSPGDDDTNKNPVSKTIAVRILKGVFAVGDVVKLAHPSYNGKYDVIRVWDAGDGGGTAFLETPYIDTGERASNGNVNDKRQGTISVVGEASEMEASGGRRVRFLGKAEAKERKRKQLIGKAAGKKGAELRSFIRKGNQHLIPKGTKTFVKKQSAGTQSEARLEKRKRGADGSASWSNAHGNMC